MKKVFDFKQQLNVGDVGEKLFLDFYSKRKATKSTTDRAYDFLIDGDKKVELKTDTYSMSATSNFFMERYGCNRTFKSGGPWRAKEDKIDFFVYFFINDKVLFWFNPVTLCDYLDTYIVGKHYKEIKNRAWTAVGYAVPRTLCEPYLLNKDIII